MVAASVLAASLWAPPALAQTAPPDPGAAAPPCAVSGDPSVLVEGRPMLRLGDVIGCEGVRYEVIPNLLIGGQPAVRLTPDGPCQGGGAVSVIVDGAPAARAGDAVCR